MGNPILFEDIAASVSCVDMSQLWKQLWKSNIYCRVELEVYL